MPTVFNSNMVMERSGADEVKFYFTILHLHPDWIWMRPEIAVNDFQQISYDGGDWHGSASYDFSDNGLAWELTFHPRANSSLMKTFTFTRVPETEVFLSENRCCNNSMLLVKKILD
jgi:hypothetical protein